MEEAGGLKVPSLRFSDVNVTHMFIHFTGQSQINEMYYIIEGKSRGIKGTAGTLWMSETGPQCFSVHVGTGAGDHPTRHLFVYIHRRKTERKLKVFLLVFSLRVCSSVQF